ncbi:hypothetical protein H2198_010625 [Neophaeococcomyces mojaviensis]|uniref:Uncharacterized protein n=1 Tax=Neophaeococcomyces mojaviensis TaxID=3383035 RepID=A0ACC2ZRM6_9EURO|nr:hypothetical protein H2198_010625 [Knufia sp. JES_112]
MPQPLTLPTWVLLNPGSLIPASEVDTLLGALVEDFEQPLGHYVPTDISKLRAKFAQCVVLEDTDFAVTVERLRSQNVQSTLGTLFEATRDTSQGHAEERASPRITTYTLKQHDMIFKEVKKRHSPEVHDMIEKAPRRNKGAVFMVVGIKVSDKTQVKSTEKVDRSFHVQAGVPVNDIVLASTGVPLPVTADVSAGFGKGSGSKLESTLTTVGGRIFAIQYRLVRRHRKWFDFAMPKAELHTMDYHTVNVGKGLFSGDDVAKKELDEDGEEDEGADDEESDEENIVDDDELELGDVGFTAALKEDAAQAKLVIL